MEMVTRSFSSLYVLLDCIWLVLFCATLFFLKRRKALLAGLVGGIIYFIVDYGIFYLFLKTRVVMGADPFAYLLWLSFSYGITNFAWIWLMLDRDRLSAEWTVMILSAWLAVGFLSHNFGAGFPLIGSSRGTGSYHGVMALILFAGYFYLAVQNIRSRNRGSEKKVDILYLIAIGIGIQLMWEFALLITGIRPTGLKVLIENSLIETNLGIPYLYLIHRWVTHAADPTVQKLKQL
jgi:hypothetical protein